MPRQDVTAETAHQILKRISDEDARKLGFDPQFTRPDWMVITVLPVPPPQVRPSIQMEGAGGRGEDDLTVKLMDIVRCPHTPSPARAPPPAHTPRPRSAAPHPPPLPPPPAAPAAHPP